MNATLTKAGFFAAAIYGLLCTVSSAQNSATPEVEVHAHRGVQSQQIGRDRAGIPITEATMTLGVSVSDLDLSTGDGQKEARQRIFAAAHEACMDIAREFPEEVHAIQKCQRETARDAEPELKKLVLAASEKPGAAR